MSEGARREKRKLKLNVVVQLLGNIFMLLHKNALVLRLFKRPFQ